MGAQTVIVEDSPSLKLQVLEDKVYTFQFKQLLLMEILNGGWGPRSLLSFSCLSTLQILPQVKLSVLFCYVCCSSFFKPDLVSLCLQISFSF